MRTKENIQYLNQLKKTVNALPDSKFEQAAFGIICAVVQKFPLTYFSILNSNRFGRLRTLVLKRTAFLDKYETERKKKFTFATRIYYFISKKTQQPEIAFEVDGIYWHSKGKKVQGYHLEKTKKCEALGIKLVHIFEDEWAFHRADMQKLIVNILQDKLDFNFSDDVIEVDRCKFNKCVKIPGYLLAAETAPTYIVRSMVEDKNECQKSTYEVEDCGKLIYKKD